jgi:hypothetical protein
MISLGQTVGQEARSQINHRKDRFCNVLHILPGTSVKEIHPLRHITNVGNKVTSLECKVETQLFCQKWPISAT